MKPNQITHEEVIANLDRFIEESVAMRKAAAERRKEWDKWSKKWAERRKEWDEWSKESAERRKRMNQSAEEADKRLRKMEKNREDFDKFWKWIIIALVILQGLPWDRIFR